jgi:hypothetical protein
LITPKPRSAEIILRNRALAETANLVLNLVTPAFPPATDNTYSKSRMFNEFLEFIIERDESGCSFSVESKECPVLSLKQHVTLNKVMRIFSAGHGTMEMRTGRRRVLLADFDNTAPQASIDTLDFTREILRKIDAIVNLAGNADIQLSVEDINSQIGAIRFIHDLISEPGGSSRASAKIIPTGEFPDDLSNAEALIIGQMVFHDSAIAYSATGTVEISGDITLKKMQISQMRLRQVSFIEVEPSALDEFKKDMEAETGLGLVLQLGSTGIRVTQDMSDSEGAM